MRLGADPEVFLINPEGKHISAIGLIGADKWNPLQMEDLPKGYTLQEDNVALEYGIPPASSAEEFFHHINLVMEESLKYVYTGLKFSKLSCTIFEADQMQNPMAYVFGCEPDWDGWTGLENKKPKPPHEYMRSAGGHIHVETEQDCQKVVQHMDLFLSVPAVLMDEGEQRKQLYGKAGAFRKKSYGVEYRSPSNFWMAPGGTEEERKKLCHWVWRNTERALAANLDFGNGIGELIQHCVNKNDKELAHKLIKDFELEVV